MRSIAFLLIIIFGLSLKGYATVIHLKISKPEKRKTTCMMMGAKKETPKVEKEGVTKQMD